MEYRRERTNLCQGPGCDEKRNALWVYWELPLEGTFDGARKGKRRASHINDLRSGVLFSGVARKCSNARVDFALPEKRTPDRRFFQSMEKANRGRSFDENIQGRTNMNLSQLFLRGLNKG